MQRSRVRPPSSAGLDTVLLAVASVLVAAPHLGSPGVLVFDEHFYVGDAVSHLDVGVGLGFQAHPPLGTWLLAAGVRIFGETPVGWRVVPLLFGVISVVLLHRLALRVLPDGRWQRVLAAAAAVLLIADGSWFVLTRTAMLDGLLTTLVVGAVASAVAAVDRRGRPGGRRWLLVAGIVSGAAVAVKWSGAFGLVLAAAIVALARSNTHERRPVHATAASIIVGLALLTYGLSWTPFAVQRGDVPLATCPAEAAPCVAEGGIAGVVAQHRTLLRYHTTVRFSGGYESAPSLWPVSYRPVTLYRASCDVPGAPEQDPFSTSGSCPPDAVPGDDALTYVGNPVVWLLFVALLPFLGVAARRGDRAAWLALAGWAVQWLPWLGVTRSSFLYYMAPAVPFMALGTIVAVVVLPRVRPNRVLAAATAGAVAGLTISLIPGVPPGMAFVGWGAGGFAPGLGADLTATGDTSTAPAWLAGTTAAAALVALALMLPTWTAAS